MGGFRPRTICIAVAATVALAVAAAPAIAAEQSFKVTMKHDITSVVFDADAPGGPLLHVALDGAGVARPLGPVTGTIDVTQVVADGCDDGTSLHTIAAAGGTLVLASVDRVCPPPGGGTGDAVTVVGAWRVIGGTGQFAGATGAGTTKARIGGQGNVVTTLEGAITTP